jgi:isohexenylglutaconyl-CoA hydratase
VNACGASAGGWLAWRTLAITRKAGHRIVFGGLGALILAVSVLIGLSQTAKGPIDWTYYTPERLAAAQQRNHATGQRFIRLCNLPQVVIAAVQGSAHAGGLGWLCAADIAIATADARFAAPEAKRGLVPAQILPWMVRRMGRSNAARMVLQGNVIDAPEAARIGLVHQLVADAAALEAAVQAVIADCRQGAPRALAETKKLIAALGPLSPDGYAEAGALAFARCASGDEAREGIAAFKEKRPPSWAS